MMWDDEAQLRLRFWRSPDVGPRRFWQAYHRYGSIKLAYGHVPLVGEATLQAEIEQTLALGAYFVFFQDFPHLFKRISDLPPVLVLKGQSDIWHQSCVAIVGGRNASYAGKTMARRLAKGLGEAGHIVVSGLARGIDGAAHEASCDTGTIAVVAGGVDVIYPQEHEKLHKSVTEKGLIVAEMPLGTMPQPCLFPRRNRLIAALSRAVVVVEAGRPSGSLITAEYALKYGRDVLAVPGSPVDARTRGSNSLLREGAALVESVEDCLHVLSPSLDPVMPVLIDTVEDNDSNPYTILSDLSVIPMSLDELIHLHPEISPQHILRHVGELMMQGEVMDIPPGGRYVRTESSL